MPPDDEKALIREARAGSRTAFEELVRRYDRRVLRLALGLLRSEDEARDVYQETFLRVYRGLPRFRMESAFETWIVRVATNVCLDRLRRREASRDPGADRRVGSGRDDRSDGVDGDRGGESLLDRIADDRPQNDPERALARREIGRRIRAALRRLPPRERLVFALRHDHGLRLGAIAEILETSEETARNCLCRAHRSLRALLGDLRGSAGPSGSPERAGPAKAEA